MEQCAATPTFRWASGITIKIDQYAISSKLYLIVTFFLSFNFSLFTLAVCFVVTFAATVTITQYVTVHIRITIGHHHMYLKSCASTALCNVHFKKEHQNKTKWKKKSFGQFGILKKKLYRWPSRSPCGNAKILLI